MPRGDCVKKPDPRGAPSALAGALLVLAGLVPVGAAQAPIRARLYTELDGLPHSSVLDLERDDLGRIWCRTGAGVVCFDGTVMTLIPREELERRPDGYGRLVAAGEGRMWYVSASVLQGPTLLSSRGIVRRHPMPPELAGLVVHDAVTIPSADGPLLVIAQDRPFLSVLREGRWERWDLPGGLEARALTEDGGRLRAIGTFGLAEVDADRSRVLVPFDSDSTTRRWTLAHQRRPEGGRDWVADGQTLRYRDEGDATWTTIDEGFSLTLFGPQSRIVIAPIASGDVLVARSQSLVRIPADGSPIETVAGMDPWPSGAFDILEADDRIWIGHSRGLLALKALRWVPHPRSSQLLETEVSVVLPREEELILGHDIGVTRLGPGRRSEHLTFGDRAEPSAEGVRVTDIASDRDGGLWLATGPLGLLHLDGAGERSWFPRRRPDIDQPFRMPEDSVCYALLVDRPGEVVAGMHDTLMRVNRDGTSEALYRDILPPRLLIRRLARDARGRLLMASGFRGVWREDRGGIGRLPSPPGAAESCYGFAFWRGRMLVCAADGLFEIVEDEIVPFRDEGLDLEGDRIYAALAASDGTLLLGTQRGVVCWDGVRSTRDTVEDGLGGLEVNRAALVEDAERRVLVGTNGGLSLRVGPPHARRRPPRLVFATARSGATEIDVERSQVKITGGEALSFTIRTVTFDSRASLRIRYRLEGAEAEWTELPGSHDGGIHFTGLAPGRYRLVAELRGADGSWGSRVSSPEITLSAPVWNRPWFLTIAGGAALGVVALALAFARTRRRNALLARELAEGARALREREHSFADAFQRHAVPQAILAGPGPEIRDLNRAARHLFRELGLAPEGTPLTAMIVGATDPFERAAERCRREGSVERVHAILRGPLGRKTLELLISPLVTADGTDLQVVLLDATRRHRLENELREAYKELAVGRTTRAFAHDFNNLLLVLGGNAEVALDRAEREGRPADRELAEICGAVERGRQLVRRLAGLGEEGRRRRTRFAPDESLAAATDEILRQLAGQAEVVCDIRRGAPSALVDGDERSFRAALIELVDNAREAMPRGGRITITSGLTSEAPRRYFVEVCDEGEGFAPEHLARVAEPFFSTRPAESGRGLGLAEVRRFATRSGGRFDVANREDGSGARIRIELPLASDATPVPRVAPEAGAREVLAIGPDEVQRRQLAEALAPAGLRLATAADGPDAMRIFSHLEHRIAAVVLFPGLDGIESRELTRILRGERADLDVVPFEAIADPALFASSVERWRRPRTRVV